MRSWGDYRAVRVGTGDGYTGGYWGRVYGRAGPGYYPATLLGEGPCSSEAGPQALQGPEWWEHGAGRALQSWTTLRARSVTPGALPVQDLRFPVKRPCKPLNASKQ